MRCRDETCMGEYEEREVLHVERRKGQVVVFDRVPALVCSACGEVFFRLETLRGMDALLERSTQPTGTAPVYEYRAAREPGERALDTA